VDIVQALSAPRGPACIPVAYEAAARAKLKRDRASYAAFRVVDQAEYERGHLERVTAEVARWAEEVRLFGEDIAELEPEAVAALAAARAAEDRAREAGEYARTQRLEYERVRGKVPVQVETEASLRADAADETAHHAAGDAETAAGESREADVALAEAREGLAAAEGELARAREMAAVPAGEAPVSDVTMRACSAFMQQDEVWDQLSDRDRFRVRQAGEPRDMLSSAQFQEMLRATFGGQVEAV